MLARQRREAAQHGNQEKSEPHAFALAACADQVHAIVPVAGPHQGQAVLTVAKAMANRAHAMLVEARRLCGRFGQLVIRLFAVLQNSAIEEMTRFAKNARVTRGFDVAAGRQRQPQIVVGAAGAHALARGRVPPVLHVAFRKLA